MSDAPASHGTDSHDPVSTTTAGPPAIPGFTGVAPDPPPARPPGPSATSDPASSAPTTPSAPPPTASSEPPPVAYRPDPGPGPDAGVGTEPGRGPIAEPGVAAEPAAPAAPTTTGPPLGVLALATASVVISLVLVVPDTFAAHVLGYALASLPPIVGVGLFRRLDLTRRVSPYYVPQPLVDRLIPGLLVLALVAVVAHIWPIATELAS